MHRNRGYLESVLSELRGLGYAVDCRMLNAAGYGTPQNRLRVIAVGHHGGFEFPERGARPVTAGEAVGDTTRMRGRNPKFLTPSMDKYVAVYEEEPACHPRGPTSGQAGEDRDVQEPGGGDVGHAQDEASRRQA